MSSNKNYDKTIIYYRPTIILPPELDSVLLVLLFLLLGFIVLLGCSIVIGVPFSELSGFVIGLYALSGLLTLVLILPRAIIYNGKMLKLFGRIGYIKIDDIEAIISKSIPSKIWMDRSKVQVICNGGRKYRVILSDSESFIAELTEINTNIKIQKE